MRENERERAFIEDSRNPVKARAYLLELEMFKKRDSVNEETQWKLIQALDPSFSREEYVEYQDVKTRSEKTGVPETFYLSQSKVPIRMEWEYSDRGAIGQDIITAIEKHGPIFRNLVLSSPDEMAFKVFLDGASIVEELSLEEINHDIGSQLLFQLGRMKKLRKLKIVEEDGELIEDAHFANLALIQLEEIYLEFCQNITGEGFSQMRCPALKRLTIIDSDRLQADHFIELAKNSPDIEEICITMDLESHNQYEDEWFAILREFKKLKKLELNSHKKLTFEFLRSDGELPIEELRLFECQNIDFDSVGEKLTHLKKLKLRHIAINRESLMKLLLLPNLESVEFHRLDMVNINESDLEDFKNQYKNRQRRDLLVVLNA